MKLLLKISVTVLVSGLLLTGCDNDSSRRNAAFQPDGQVFSDFVTGLFSADPATATPTEINDTNFSFIDQNNTAAFDSQLN